MADEEEDDWFGGFGGFDLDDDQADGSEPINEIRYDNAADAMARIGQSEDEPCQDYRIRTKLVDSYMGSMALCRGQQGEDLREAGAIHAILKTLTEIIDQLPPANASELTQLHEISVKLAIACWGAGRDLGCGSTGNREALREIEIDGIGGMQLLSMYLERYCDVHWRELDPLQANLLTTVIGAMRNVTHSTTQNCTQLHAFGVSEMLIWRLTHASSCDSDDGTISLPDASSPWREGAFRSASTLINMAEKCRATAELCGKDAGVVRLLVESWGGTQKQQPLLHLGLAAILRCAKEQLAADRYAESWDEILSNEKGRKVAAQKHEEERKKLARTNFELTEDKNQDTLS